MTRDESKLLRLDRARPVGAELGPRRGVLVDEHFDRATCARWVRGIVDGRDDWMSDFGGEQFSLGRAFYTHLEEDRTRAYFTDAAASDARVEVHAPGLQDAMRSLVSTLTGGRAVARAGFCGPGVHIFPRGGEVAKNGGVVHFDTEGLGRHQLAAHKPALSIVAMLQPAGRGGALRLWDVRYAGRDAPSAAELETPNENVPYRIGSVVAFDSYRLHQIRPFSGPTDRISATVHAALVDEDLWETWF